MKGDMGIDFLCKYVLNICVFLVFLFYFYLGVFKFKAWNQIPYIIFSFVVSGQYLNPFVDILWPKYASPYTLHILFKIPHGLHLHFPPKFDDRPLFKLIVFWITAIWKHLKTTISAWLKLFLLLTNSKLFMIRNLL